MGQFKPMVKMTTTEPSVMLKLKDGGHVNMKKGGHAKQEKESGHKAMPKMMDGGAMGALASTPALVGRPAVNAPVRSPGRPPMSARRRAMAPIRPPRPAAPAAPAAPMGGMMKKGGEAESPAEHKSEMKAIKGLKTELKSHEGKPASKGHKGLKNGGTTGGVKEGNAGGYKRGGTVGDQMGDETTSGTPETTIMHSAKARRGQGTTGGVQEAQGGYANGGNVSRYVTNNVVSTPPGVTNMTTGSVRKGNAGGYKKGGSSKKGYATGGLVDTGRPVAMPRKPASKPVSNNRQSGTFKKGGAVEHRLEGGPLGSVTKTRESVTVTPAKKRGGMMC